MISRDKFVRRLVAATVLAALVLGLTGTPVPALASHGNNAVDGSTLELAARLTSALLEGRFDEVVAEFGPAIAGMMSVDDLAAVWTSLPLQVGTLNGIGQAWIADSEPLVFVRTPLHFDRATLDLLYGFDADLLLGTLAVVPHQPQVQGESQPPGAPSGGAGESADDSAGTDESAATPSGADVSGGATAEPPYADVTTFEEHELTFGLEQFPLGGTLTLPRGTGPFPAVVLVHGSGPADRDETAGPNKPFRDLAWGLASRGIAVFRYDKRTLVHGPAMAVDTNMTVDDETIIDAVEAVRMLRARDDISEVYIVGHSQGGMLAPYMALEEPSIDGLVLLAANARSIGTLLVEQMDYLLSGHAVPGSEPTLKAMRAEAELLTSRNLDGIDMLLGVPIGYWLDLENRNQVGVAAELPQPILILQGGRDYQVTVEDFELWKEALAHKDNVAFRLYPALNHLFLAGDGPSTPMEYAAPGFVSADVVEDIAAWIHSQE